MFDKFFNRFSRLVADLLDDLDQVKCAACHSLIKRSDANQTQMTTGACVYLCDDCYAQEFNPWSTPKEKKS